MTLYVFNPEHDYALANNDEHFMALQSAVQFANDCAPFWHYLSDDCDHFLFLPYSTPLPDLSNLHPDRIVPWGWDKLVTYQLHNAGLSDIHLPSPSKLDKLRALAHRKTSTLAMDFLRTHCPDIEIPRSAELLTDIRQVSDFIERFPDAIFKSPYSGNGRGNLYAHGIFSPTLERQCKGVLRRQGSILAEPLYNIVQDFAMEFRCHNGEVSFAGYSLFETKHYGYAGNVLCADSAIEQILQQWTDIQTLHIIREAVAAFLSQQIAPAHEGYLGVDMFIYQENGQYKLNPMVEINVRMTMGMAAHLLCERHVHPASTGTMAVEYRGKRGELRDYIQSRPPMRFSDGKWCHGTLALNPVTEETQYAVVVELQGK